MDSVSHFEIPADDMGRAQEFYANVFGWKVNAMPGMGYTIFHTGPTGKDMMAEKPGFINGGMMKRTKEVPTPVITIVVQDVKKSIAAVKKAGGVIVRDSMKVGDMGLAAYAKDTEGNLFGLWQPLKGP